ncbi:MAG: hypothetical protein JNJ77_17370 [Planctomycetia bacterium]|nr:hypothetical protein [Planctomycetia bacterium]
MIRQRIQPTLIVIVILLIAALIVVFIQRSRESAQLAACRERLGNLAQAVRRYAEMNKSIPPGYLGPNPDRKEMSPAPYVGTFVYLLPHLLSDDDPVWVEPYYQADISAKTDERSQLKPPANIPWWELTNPATNVSNRTLARRQFSFLLCPSVAREPVTEGMIVGLHSYGTKGYFDGFLQRKLISLKEDPDIVHWGVTHYLPVAGRCGTDDPFAGHFTNRSGQFGSVATLLTSGSLLFGEALGGYEPEPVSKKLIRKTAYSWFCGPLPTYYGLPEWTHRPWNAFNGPHPKGVLFAWADGSVGIFRRSFEEDEIHKSGWDDNPPKLIQTLVMKKGNTVDIGSPAWSFLQGCASRAHGLHHFYPQNTID